MLFVVPAFTGCENPQEPDLEPAAAPPARSAANDSHTLLLLRFNGSLVGYAGEQPTQASGLTFEPGVLGSGVLVNGADRLAYATSGDIQAAAGTIEFWIKPAWNGNDQLDHCFVWLQGALMLCKDGADNLRFLINEDDSEQYQVYNMGHWLAGEWHYLAVTWTVPGVMTEYIDGVQVVSHRSPDLIASMPAEMFIGNGGGSRQAGGVIDNFRISDVARTPEEIAASYASDLRIVSLAIEPITNAPFETWRQPAKLRAATNVGTQYYPPSQATWASSNPTVATVNAKGVIKAIKAGRSTITATIGKVQGSLPIRVKAPRLPPKVEPIHPYLATPASSSLYQIPVVIFRYLPTADGVTLDQAVSPGYINPITLRAMKQRLDTFDLRAKFMLEEGSRFRGYQNPVALPALGYRVVALITVYEPLPPGENRGEVDGFPVYGPDHHQILQRFNGRHFVEDLGVKEFWLWHGGLAPGLPEYDPTIHKPEMFRWMWESNMSSPTTGDISNSDRNPTDLPVYTRSYILYGQNIWRSHNEAIHNHGHQLEAMLSHANLRQDGNLELFWQMFVGRLGRAGCTEIPPNTTFPYDYRENYNPVASDIADWSPRGIGLKGLVSAHTWGEHPYPWPLGTRSSSQLDLNEAHWYIYWMQSMPGRGNTIPYGVDGMENWWRFTGDWDGSIKAGAGLYVSSLKPMSLRTARDAVRTLKGQVAALVSLGKLTSTDGTALQGRLDAAARVLDGGQVRPAANVIRGFRMQVVSLIEGGRVARPDVRTLLAGTKWLISRMAAS
jgi:hypothetical protein